MSLEDQIKQTSFASQTEKAFVNINFTHSYVSSRINSRFKSYNVSVQQYNVLRILKGQHPKPVSVNDITDRMIDKMSNVSRIIDKLKAKDLVSRELCKTDRRQVDVKITEKGLNVLLILDKEIGEWEKSFHNISEEEASTASDVLDKWRG